VLPFFHGLIGYIENMSRFGDGHLPINPRSAQVLAKCLRIFPHLPPKAAMR